MLTPDWPAPPTVQALSTLRGGGVSEGPFASLNLAMHVNDDPAHVAENRARLVQAAHLPGPVRWLKQVHGRVVVHAEDDLPGGDEPEGDAWVTHTSGIVLGVLTADCLPVVFTEDTGTRVAVAHAGWRGLADGVLEATVHALGVAPASVMAWIGPGIGAQRFAVGADVREIFLAADARHAAAFTAQDDGRWNADLAGLARRALGRCGVSRVYGGTWCTASDPMRFFSYRRDGGRTGRMATLVWIGSR